MRCTSAAESRCDGTTRASASRRGMGSDGCEWPGRRGGVVGHPDERRPQLRIRRATRQHASAMIRGGAGRVGFGGGGGEGTAWYGTGWNTK
jgi:hypothetical protein